MNKLAYLAVAMLIAAPVRADVRYDESHPLVKSLRAEIARQMDGLRVEDAPAPYFLAVTVADTSMLQIAAQNGALLSSTDIQDRSGGTDLRIGSMKFDQKNFAGGGGGTLRLPLEDDEIAIRRQLWLQLDDVYKGATEIYKAKKSSKTTRSSTEELDDFSPAPKVISVVPVQPAQWDRGHWEGVARKISAVMLGFPAVDYSTVTVRLVSRGTVFVNSEGTLVSGPANSAVVTASIIAQAEDGAPLRDSIDFIAASPDGLPGEETMLSRTRTLCERFTASVRAARGKDMQVPVLLTGEAAATLIARLLGESLGSPRRAGDFVAPNPLESYYKRKLLPDSMTMVCDPSLQEYDSQPLLGGYKYDEEGVAGQRVEVVTGGMLTGFLSCRTPTKYNPASNGHAEYLLNAGEAAPSASNLMLSGSRGKPASKLEKELLKVGRKQKAEFGLIVRRIRQGSEDEEGMPGFRQGTAWTPTDADLVNFTTGERKPVRSIALMITLTDLRDIVVYSKEAGVFTMRKGIGLNPMYGIGESSRPLSVVCPDLLFQRLAVEEVAKHNRVRPYLPNPLLRESLDAQ